MKPKQKRHIILATLKWATPLQTERNDLFCVCRNGSVYCGRNDIHFIPARIKGSNYILAWMKWSINSSWNGQFIPAVVWQGVDQDLVQIPLVCNTWCTSVPTAKPTRFSTAMLRCMETGCRHCNMYTLSTSLGLRVSWGSCMSWRPKRK